MTAISMKTLRAMPPPTLEGAGDTWRPIPHADVGDTFNLFSTRKGWLTRRMEISVNAAETESVLTWELESPKTLRSALGSLRISAIILHSTAQAHASKLLVGLVPESEPHLPMVALELGRQRGPEGKFEQRLEEALDAMVKIDYRELMGQLTNRRLRQRVFGLESSVWLMEMGRQGLLSWTKSGSVGEVDRLFEAEDPTAWNLLLCCARSLEKAVAVGGNHRASRAWKKLEIFRYLIAKTSETELVPKGGKG